MAFGLGTNGASARVYDVGDRERGPCLSRRDDGLRLVLIPVLSPSLPLILSLSLILSLPLILSLSLPLILSLSLILPLPVILSLPLPLS